MRPDQQQQTCKVCGRPDYFNFHVSSETWWAVVPKVLLDTVVCLACFDMLAHKRGIDYSADLQTLYFSGAKLSVEFRAVAVSVNDSPPFCYNVKREELIMMPVMANHESGVPPLAFNLAVAQESSLEKAPSDLAEIGQRIAGQMHDICLDLLACTTVKELRSKREKVFPLIFRFAKALTHILLITVEPKDYPRLIERSLTESRNKFVSEGSQYFGDEECKEVLFAIATLKSAQRLIPLIISNKPSDAAKDAEFSEQYAFANVWAGFHLDCLQLALSRREPLSKDILHELLDGLCVSVEAYSYARAALDLRGINLPSEKLKASWDEEDEALAHADHTRPLKHRQDKRKSN